jgi:hypothetical protein
MKTKILAAMVLGLVALSGARADDGEGWQRFAPSYGGFSVLLPGTPTSQTKKLPTPLGDGTMTMYMVTTEDSRVYMAATLDLPEALAGLADPNDMLDGFVKGLVQPFNGRVVSQSKVRLGNYPGKEVTVAMLGGQMVCRARAFAVGGRMYVVMALAPRASADLVDFEKFLDSFEIILV